MKHAASLVISILFAVVAIWLVLKLVVGVFKIVAVVIGLGLAFVVYKGAQRAIGKNS